MDVDIFYTNFWTIPFHNAPRKIISTNKKTQRQLDAPFQPSQGKVGTLSFTMSLDFKYMIGREFLRNLGVPR